MGLAEMTSKDRVELLTSREAALRMGIRPNTLEIWRVKGIGPIYLKVGRAVRYVESDVVDWLQAQARSSTSEYASVHRSNAVSR